MKRKAVTMIALRFFALALALGVARHAQAQGGKNPYPSCMAPLDQYLTGRDAEIALARSAAPPSIAQDATIRPEDLEGARGTETQGSAE